MLEDMCGWMKTQSLYFLTSPRCHDRRPFILLVPSIRSIESHWNSLTWGHPQFQIFWLIGGIFSGKDGSDRGDREPGGPAGSPQGTGGGPDQPHHQLLASGFELEIPTQHPNTNLPFLQAMTDNELYSMFITVGQIVSAKIMRDKSSGYSYGYGFVHYQQPEDAAKAIASLNGLQVFLAQRFHIMFMILTTGF